MGGQQWPKGVKLCNLVLLILFPDLRLQCVSNLIYAQQKGSFGGKKRKRAQLRK